MTTIRNQTRSVSVGTATIGGPSPVTVQSMTNVPTHDIDKCLAQIAQLTDADCEIVRVAVPTADDTAALPQILKQIKIPLVADVHFHYERAIEAIEAGVAKIRLNPGNIKDRQQVERVIAACKANNTAIRVGVNEGSIVERKDKQQHSQEKQVSLVELMVDKMRDYVRIFEDNNFDQLVLSAKCHDAARTIAVNRAIAAQFDYPLHLGVTHAGDIQTGTIRSSAALGALLAEGIGNTVRVSLAGDPTYEVAVAWELLNSLGLRPRTRPEIIACPTCGRTEINLLEMLEQVKTALAPIRQPITVAVMGCVVNGPGEADDADVALCGGKDRAAIYCQGKHIITVPADQAVTALLEQVQIFLAEKKL
ncbi:MAG: flavodoxin-dependent (E)-4-hydroxy-3-methylbut-2-enyl-diphosphate synthase [Sedimentisphaerales bacterium]|nr:flavodoxin-dependent (E)-4-hydroxy-3-methylbut-2-enyl-diphosphate synthase [Sedimentisphaerales bacterium]